MGGCIRYHDLDGTVGISVYGLATYDYYYDLTGAFWGAKSACEPVHILWNPVTDGVKIANTTACDMEGLTAEVKVYNLDGKSVEAYTKSAIVNSPSNSTVQCFTIDFNKERKICH